MKIQVIRMVVILGLLMGIGNASARAQTLNEYSIVADIPFSFVVRDTALPAGKYTVKRVDDTETHLLEIRSNKGRIAVVFEAQNAQANQIPRDAELVFDQVGDQYFLTQIWTSASEFGYQLPKTKAEERLEGSGMQSERRSILAKVLGKTKKAK